MIHHHDKSTKLGRLGYLSKSITCLNLTNQAYRYNESAT